MRIATRSALAALVCLLALDAAPALAAQNSTSLNWSGYAVTGPKFRKVTARFVVQKPDCSTRSPAYSANWVGLGGFEPNATAVEQIGIDANCNSAGKRRYHAWYEMVPAPVHNLSLAIHGGDRLTASVKVQGTSATVFLRNRTTGATFEKTVSAPSPDVKSAEWIVEAPQSCGPSDCKVLPLADFGSVPFSSAAATTASGKKKAISDPAFNVFRVTMRPRGKSYGAVPSGLSSGGTAFSVGYRNHVSSRR
jgi:Peptidase A4 family